MIHSIAVSRDARASVVIVLGYAAVPQGDLGLCQAELSQKQCLEKVETVTSKTLMGLPKAAHKTPLNQNQLLVLIYGKLSQITFKASSFFLVYHVCYINL